MFRSGALPLHCQVSESLIREIAAGKLLDGERLPPERVLAARLGVAVGTLRRALATLEEQGLIRRVQGAGNFIQAKTDVKSVYGLFRLELLEGGGLPSADLLSVERLAKIRALPRFGHHHQGHRIRRLRRLSGRPAAVEEIWLDASYVSHIAATDLSQSLYLFYRERLGLSIVRAEDRIGMGAVPEWSPSDFAPAAGAAVPLVTRLGYSADGEAAEASFTWYDPAVAAYVARLK